MTGNDNAVAGRLLRGAKSSNRNQNKRDANVRHKSLNKKSSVRAGGDGHAR
jgi:hypothetical protein